MPDENFHLEGWARVLFSHGIGFNPCTKCLLFYLRIPPCSSSPLNFLFAGCWCNCACIHGKPSQSSDLLDVQKALCESFVKWLLIFQGLPGCLATQCPDKACHLLTSPSSLWCEMMPNAFLGYLSNHFAHMYLGLRSLVSQIKQKNPGLSRRKLSGFRWRAIPWHGQEVTN